MRSLSKRWQVNALKHTVKAVVPFRHSLRKLKRRVRPRPPSIDENSVYWGGFDHIHAVREFGGDLALQEILEIGSGWYPVIPLMMHVAGAKLIHLTDVEPWLDRQTLLDAVNFLLDRKSDLAARLGVESTLIERSLTVAGEGSLASMLQQLGMTYSAPFHPERSSLKVDAIVSHTVLEHIPRDILASLFHWFCHCLRPSGLVSHGIDNSDHRANFDKSLSRLDFLRYSDAGWRLLSIGDYTNRLRHHDYKEMLECHGFEICFERAVVDDICAEEVRHLPVFGRFNQRDASELATLWSHFVARPAHAPSSQAL